MKRKTRIRKQRKLWTDEQVREMKKLAGKTRVLKIAKTVGHTEGATRQKAFSIGLSLRYAA